MIPVIEAVRAFVTNTERAKIDEVDARGMLRRFAGPYSLDFPLESEFEALWWEVRALMEAAIDRLGATGWLFTAIDDALARRVALPAEWIRRHLHEIDFTRNWVEWWPDDTEAPRRLDDLFAEPPLRAPAPVDEAEARAWCEAYRSNNSTASQTKIVAACMAKFPHIGREFFRDLTRPKDGPLLRRGQKRKT